MSKPVKLVLSGSGTRYPVFIGAVRALERAGYTFSEVCGVSGGSIVAAGIAAGMDGAGLERLAKTTLPGPLLDRRWLADILQLHPYHGIWKGEGILKKLSEVLPQSFSGYKIPLHVVTFNLDRGVYRIWSPATAKEFDNVPRLVRASMSLPVFDSCLINGEWHEDGGFGANFPLDVFGKGEDVIGLRFAGTNPRAIRRFKNKIDRLLGMIDDFIEAAAREHVEDALFARVCTLWTAHKGMDLEMTVDDVEEMIFEGESQTQAWLKRR